MSTDLLAAGEPAPVSLLRPRGRSPWLLLCDHASRRLPASVGTLGLSAAERRSHIAWDIGAAALAQLLSRQLDAVLIRQNYSRLLVDCNRPPDSDQAIPEQSGGSTIPGNIGLSAKTRVQRHELIFAPYHARIAQEIDRRTRSGQATLILAVHSFTPVWEDQLRPWQLGLMYHRDPRLAAPLLQALRAATADPATVGDNLPYAMEDAYDYSLPVHGEQRGLRHVGLEVRQDLIGNAAGRARIAAWLYTALKETAHSHAGHGPETT